MKIFGSGLYLKDRSELKFSLTGETIQKKLNALQNDNNCESMGFPPSNF